MSFVSEIRYAIRSLLKAPALSAVIVASLAVGIGATAVAYSWIDAFMLRPFPAVKASDRLVGVFTRGPAGAEWSVSYPRYKRWRDAVSAFDGMVVHSERSVSLRAGNFGPERVFAELVSGNYFDVLGVAPLVGRTFQPKEEGEAAQVVVLSQTFWQRVFAGDRGIVGKQITLNGHGFTVVGVAPAGFGGTMVGLGFDLWVPVTTIPVLEPGNQSLTGEGWQWLNGLARLKPGVGVSQAEAAFRDAARHVSESLGETQPTIGGLRLLAEEGAGKFLGPMFYTLLGLSLVLLLVACANIANLLLVRAASRTKEISVRLAIGAGRGRIVRQLFTESLLLASVGAGLGLLLAALGRNSLMSFLPKLPFPITLTSEINVRVVLVTVAVTVGTAVLVGLLPALKASRPDLLPALKDEQVPGSRRSLLRSGLVVAQVALSLVALGAAGLFIRSLANSKMADPGFSGADEVLLIDTSTRLAGLSDSAGSIARDRLFDQIRQLPGVKLVSLTNDVPLSIGGHNSSTMEVEGYTPGRDENMSIENGQVGPGYFEALQIPIKGRGFTVDDRKGSPRVVVVNEAFAKRFWPNLDPVGRRVKLGGPDWWTVVGVAGNVKMETIGEAPYPYYYIPVLQDYSAEFTLTVRSSTDPKSLIEPIRKIFASVDPNLPVLDPRTLRENMAGALFVQSAGARLLGILGGLALLLATVGLYGVLSYSVSQRTREIGIRVALGAEGTRVVGLVVRQAVGLTAVGLVVGAGLAFGVGRLLSSQLFGVSPGDPLVFGAIAGLLGLVAVLASVVPARRASAIDPIRALRSE